MKSKIQQAMMALETAKKRIKEKNYQQSAAKLNQAYSIYQEVYGEFAIETILMIDRIIRICENQPQLEKLRDNYLEERKYIENGQVESDWYEE